MAHKHSIYDVDTHFSIDPVTRLLKNEGSAKAHVIQTDHNSERFTFEIPRTIADGHDMSLCNSIQIHYLNVGKAGEKYEGLYEVGDMQVCPEDDDIVILSWLISREATQYVGSLNFVIRFACISDDGKTDFVWNTAIYSNIAVAEGIYNTGVVIERYPDILAEWQARLLALETGGTSPVVADWYAKTELEQITDEAVNFYDSVRFKNRTYVPAHREFFYVKLDGEFYRVFIDDYGVAAHHSGLFSYSENVLTVEPGMPHTASLWREKVEKMPTAYLPDSVAYAEEGWERIPMVTFSVYRDNRYSTLLKNPVGLKVGETYLVNWHGTEFECVGIDVSEMSDGLYQGVGIGNTAILGGADTGEPFGIVEFSPEFQADTLWANEGGWGLVGRMDGEACTQSFEVYRKGKDIKKLDNRCLDTDWKPTHKGRELFPALKTWGTGTLSRETSGKEAIGFSIMLRTEPPKDFPLDGSVKIIAEVNGQMEVGTWGTKDGATGFIFSDFIFTIHDLGVAGVIYILHAYSSAVLEIAIYEYVENKMPEEFLPEDGIIIRSSTLGSNKRFRLTINDSGVIRPVEIF